MKATADDHRAIAARRADFPSLQRKLHGRPLVYLDGPAGTQMPQQAINGIVEYYKTSNANTHGQFVTARVSDEMIQQTRESVAAFLGAEGGHCISFGANMTTLNFALSKAIARQLKPGDEVLITQLDHEANRGPWLALRDHGIVVREIGITRNASLDYADFRAKVNERTRLVALGWASNAFGTVNDIRLARELAYRVGALLLVDAVHFAPHMSMDVRSFGVDFLLCSAYKFYGPHVGILYAKEGLLDSLQTDRLRTADPRAPHRIETGTLNHAALAGVRSAVEYIASLGHGDTQRARLVSAMELLFSYEHTLGDRLYRGLSQINGVTVYGLPFRREPRAPTVSFTVRGFRAEEFCAALGEKGFCTWDGHFYALRAMEVLGLLELGGVVRIGVSLYTNADEIDRLLTEIRKLSKQ